MFVLKVHSRLLKRIRIEGRYPRKAKAKMRFGGQPTKPPTGNSEVSAGCENVVQIRQPVRLNFDCKFKRLNTDRNHLDTAG